MSDLPCLLICIPYRNFYYLEKSTLRAKCRAIWNWYNSRDWTIPVNRKTKTDEELLMTRRERALSNAKTIKEQKRKIILNTLTGMFATEYKRKNGAWNISKLSRDLKMSDNTIRKHLKEMQEEGLIK